MAATFVTVGEWRMRLDATQTPAGAEGDALLQEFLDSAEATVLRQLTGVVIEAPAPDDLKEIIYQLASSLYITRGTAARLETIGVEGQGGYEYAGGLTPGQKAALRQIRIELHGLTV